MHCGYLCVLEYLYIFDLDDCTEESGCLFSLFFMSINFSQTSRIIQPEGEINSKLFYCLSFMLMQ